MRTMHPAKLVTIFLACLGLGCAGRSGNRHGRDGQRKHQGEREREMGRANSSPKSLLHAIDFDLLTFQKGKTK